LAAVEPRATVREADYTLKWIAAAKCSQWDFYPGPFPNTHCDLAMQ
jgi:hypothetical protein